MAGIIKNKPDIIILSRLPRGTTYRKQVAMLAAYAQPPAPLLPVQAPTKFGLVVNLKTAKAAMLSSVLGGADEVVD
jgi:hypothetical protein